MRACRPQSHGNDGLMSPVDPFASFRCAAELARGFPDGVRALQLENGKAAAQFWDTFADRHGGTAGDHEHLIANAEAMPADRRVGSMEISKRLV